MIMFEDIIEDEMDKLKEMVRDKKLLNNKANNFYVIMIGKMIFHIMI